MRLLSHSYIAVILELVYISFITLGAFHASQTAGDISTPVRQLNLITCIALFAESGYGIVFGIPGVLSYLKYRNYKY